MRNRTQIIIKIITITVLGLLTCVIGYWVNLPKESTGKPLPPYRHQPNALTQLMEAFARIPGEIITDAIREAVGVQPPRELTEKDFAGTYEYKDANRTFRKVLLDNGVMDNFLNGKKINESFYMVLDNKVHVGHTDGGTSIWRINPDDSITEIAIIDERGERKDFSKYRYKKILRSQEGFQLTRELTLKEKDVVGAYEHKDEKNVLHRYALLDNGVVVPYINGEKRNEQLWEIVDKEIHIVLDDGNKAAHRINPDGSITKIAFLYIDERGRGEIHKGNHVTFKKIK